MVDLSVDDDVLLNGERWTAMVNDIAKDEEVMELARSTFGDVGEADALGSLLSDDDIF